MNASTAPPGAAALHLDGVGLERGHRSILDGITWTVEPDQRWLVLGANGSGKTSLLRIAALYEHPTRGRVQVLGETLGAVDVRSLRRRIGFASAALAAQLRPDLAALDVVMTAKHAALEPWWHTYDDDDRGRAADCLARMGVGDLAERRLGSLSSGEQQRVLLARTLMTDPGLVLLDEPSARLDLAGREHLVAALAELAADPTSPAMALVTHHVDEVPPGITHVLLLHRGRVLAAGPLAATLTSETVSACFELPLRLERRDDGRFSAFALTPARSRA
jgi:iron complex transport system ATP-binding protein